MKQVYHSNAVTNIHIRSEINGSNLKNSELAEKYNVSEPTVSKWKNRNSLEDKTSKPHTIHYSLTELEKNILIQIRMLTWWALDEIAEAFFPDNLLSKRSTVYRVFKKEGINKKPEEEREKAKKFKEYEPGYLHIDVTYLPKINGVKYYLFVAIDRATRTLYYKVYEAKTAENAEVFMNECIDFFPFGITHVLTDNGLEFTNKLIKSKKGAYCKKDSKLDEVCKENDIEHRLTKPGTPKTNGMVEKANDTIKQGTVKRNEYADKEQMNNDLMSFLVHYNLYRRHGSLRKELNVKTPCDAIEKWYKIKPEIFNEKPGDFKKKILFLKSNLKTSSHKQPGET
ncbi:MAG: DDE-type integrase/transposase/recombinase [Mariniphaga sp.]|nr:DDE-type integrase/transposase/recombinase [Mariniphaga sp.]